MDLNGAIAIVTGAVRGIGKAIARAHVEHRARVALVDPLAGPSQETADGPRSEGGQIPPIWRP